MALDLTSSLASTLAALLNGKSPGTATQNVWNATSGGTWNAGSFLAAADLTCFSQRSTFWAVAVGPHTLLSATHCTPNPCSGSLWKSDGTQVNWTSRSVANIGNDICVILTNETISGITFATIPLGNWKNLLHATTDPVMVVYGSQLREMFVGWTTGSLVWGQEINSAGNLLAFYQQQNPDAAWSIGTVPGDSSSPIGIVPTNGHFYLLSSMQLVGAGPDYSQYLSQIQAQTTDTLQTIDLTQTYAIPGDSIATTTPSTPPPPPPIFYGGINMITNFNIYADGSGQYPSINAAMTDPTFLNTTGIVQATIKGNMGNTTINIGDLACGTLILAPYTGWVPSLSAIPNDSANACILGLTVQDGGGTYESCGTLIVDVMIGSKTSSGSITLSYGNFDFCTWFNTYLNNVRVHAGDLGPGLTKYLVSIADQNDGGTTQTSFNTYIQNTLIEANASQSATNFAPIRTLVNNGNSVHNVFLTQSGVDGYFGKGTLGLVEFQNAGVAAGVVNFQFANSIIVGASASQATFTNHMTAGTLNLSGSYLITSDSQTNGTHLTGGVLVSGVWANYTNSDFTLQPGSKAIGLATTTTIATDFFGAARPRVVNSANVVDAGPANFVIGTVVESISSLVWSWTAFAGASTYQYSTNNGVTWTATGSGGTATTVTLSSTIKQVLVEALDANNQVIGFGTANQQAGGAVGIHPWLGF